MSDPPEFPQFTPLSLADRDFLQGRFDAYRPETSELTFTNLFIWGDHYGVEWCLHRECLLLLCTRGAGAPFFLPPTGPASRREVVGLALDWLRRERGVVTARIERADTRLVEELSAEGERFAIAPNREHFDYLYPTENLITLPGKPYHAKRNHINRFLRGNRFEYAALGAEHLRGCLDLAAHWCTLRECSEDLSLTDEWGAVRLALENFTALRLTGGAILVGGILQAFSLGEWLNPTTAVIHIEKANPEIPELYPIINQQFCERAWASTAFINREQDLGEENLRKAKLSYHPERLVEKHTIRLASSGTPS